MEPPNGAAPQMIPDRWRDSPEDELRFDLPDKTDDELVALGWKKVDFPLMPQLVQPSLIIDMIGIVQQEHLMQLN